MVTEAVGGNARFTPDPIANAGYLYLRPGIKRGEFYRRVEQPEQKRALDYSETGELLGVDFLDLKKVNIGLLPEDNVIPQEKELISLLENGGVTGIEGTTRDLYRDWISKTLTDEFGRERRRPQVVVDFFGDLLMYEKNQWGGIEDLISNAYGMHVPEAGRRDFRGAIADVVGAKVADPNPNLKEIKTLLILVGDIMIPEVATPLAEAVLNNEAIKSDPEIKSIIYYSVQWLTSQAHVLDHREDANAALQRLIDHPEFDESWLFYYVEGLLHFKPSSVGIVVEEYGQRIEAFKNDRLTDKRSKDWYSMISEQLIEHLQRNSVKLTPKQLAILQI